MKRLPKFLIGDDAAYAFGIRAARLAARVLWEEGATGLNRPPLWVRRENGEPVGYHAADGWTTANPGVV